MNPKFKRLCLNKAVLQNVLVSLHETSGDLTEKEITGMLVLLYDAFFRTIFCFVNYFVIPIYWFFLDLIDMQLIDSLSGGYIFGLAKGIFSRK